jgi:hypothetical protein
MIQNLSIKNFSLKFIDIMIGVVLGLGFQWWPNLTEKWQIAAFIFVYIDIIDYWIDYGPSLKKFPPIKEVDVFLDVAIVFSMFLYIYSTQLQIIYLLLAFVLLRIFDFFWLLSSKNEFYSSVSDFDKKYLKTWLRFDIFEIIMALMVFDLYLLIAIPPLSVLIIYIFLRISLRVIASLQYKKAYFS